MRSSKSRFNPEMIPFPDTNNDIRLRSSSIRINVVPWEAVVKGVEKQIATRRSATQVARRIFVHTMRWTSPRICKLQGLWFPVAGGEETLPRAYSPMHRMSAAAAGYCLMDLTAMNAAPYGPKRAEAPSMRPISLARISDGG